MTEAELLNILGEYKQHHLIEHYKGLSSEKKAQFLKNLEGLDIKLVFSIYRETLTNRPFEDAVDIRPARIIRLPQIKAEFELRKRASINGQSLIKDRRVAVLIVAGGQGSRLGYDGPKGVFPITPVKRKSFFQLYTEVVHAISLRYGVDIPLLFMTSEDNHDETMKFFMKNDYFGLKKENISFFKQGLLPSLTEEGNLVLKNDVHLFTNPDGHGGALKALYTSGLLGELLDKGYTELFYCQIDNPLVRILDPVFLGYHMMTEAEVSTKVVRRRDTKERVGIYLNIDGKDRVIEYSDMPAEYMEATDKRGAPLYWAGNAAIHIFSLSFIERLNKDGFVLPYHIARKRADIPQNGGVVSHILKFETFVFDAIPFAKRQCCMEIKREEEFAPVKNMEGDDSPEKATEAMSNLFKAWFTEAGISLPPDVQVEISPFFAIDKEEFIKKVKGKELKITGRELYLE